MRDGLEGRNPNTRSVDQLFGSCKGAAGITYEVHDVIIDDQDLERPF